jgi:Amidase
MTPLTERSATGLARAIRRREVSARDVVEAHIERHMRFASRVNAVVADRFEAARREAVAADERVAAADGGEASELPPLLGVPFTVKESIALAGMPQSAGLVARRDYRSGESAPVVQRLLDAGAIPLGVTNTSELTLWIESRNPLYGLTSNPYDSNRTAGGSSGGEGRGGRLGRIAVRRRGRHRRLGPGPGVLLRRVRPQAVAGVDPEHRDVSADSGRRRVAAAARPDRPPRGGPDAAAEADGRA